VDRFNRVEYHQHQAVERDFAAATTERPLLMWKKRSTRAVFQ
jgi:hypothetical protein